MRLKLSFTADAWAEYLEWQESDGKGLRRLNRLIEEARRTPHEGIGKPEALRGDLAGFWSRRIDGRHRLVYKADGDSLLIAQCRYHY